MTIVLTSNRPRRGNHPVSFQSVERSARDRKSTVPSRSETRMTALMTTVSAAAPRKARRMRASFLRRASLP